jgi:hypothetical protein
MPWWMGATNWRSAGYFADGTRWTLWLACEV